MQGGVFIEGSQFSNLVDNNFIWNVDGNGIYLNDSDETLVIHNLVANTTGPTVHAVASTGRSLNGRKLTAKNNRIINNMFIDCGESMKFDSEKNIADYNLYVTSKQPEGICLKEWQTKGYNKNSSQIEATVMFNANVKYFSFSTKTAIPKVPISNEVKTDFYGNQRTGKNTVAGSFIEMNTTQKIILNENNFN